MAITPSPDTIMTVLDMATDISPRALVHLCQLVSPALPIGAYAYSQGLEYAVQAGWVADEADCLDWLQGLAHRGPGSLDLPLLQRLHAAWCRDDIAAVKVWNAQLLAARETSELRAEERHLGHALARVLVELGLHDAQPWQAMDAAYATLLALAAARWQIPLRETLAGYLWAWSENQVLAAVKSVPLGQSAGQRVLRRLADAIPHIVELALALPDEAIGVGVLLPVIASALHESQYSRLFRS